MENNNDEFRVVKIPFFKKIWLSITKFERYPEMATEGVGRAFLYLVGMILIFSIIITAGLLYSFNNSFKQGLQYVDQNISEINYKDGILEINPNNQDTIQIENEMGTLIIDTITEDEEKIREYEKSIKNDDLGVIWLNDKVVLYSGGIEEAYYYGDILEGLEIESFNKSDLINLLSNNNLIYIIYFVVMLITTFIAYFVATIIDVLVLSIFGILTSYMAGIRIRYRAIFNMSIYAFTISVILRLIYILIGMFTDFTIKYFDFMYSAIAYICLMASIFMIKSDVIKQQIELIKIREKMKEQKQQEPEEEKQKEEKKEEEKTDKKEEKEEKGEEEPGAENQGSHA